MRILHTSDWHLGIQLHGESLLEDQREMIHCLLETVKRERVEAVLLAGDVFDHAVAKPEAIGLYNDAMTGLCLKLGVPVLLCAGNHDGAARLAACGDLLRNSGLHIAGRLERHCTPVLLGDCAFFLLPWFNTDEVRALWPEEEIRGTGEAMACVLERLELVENRRNLLIGHCFVAGAQTGESDRAAMVGGGGRIPVDLFEKFDYVALGHLHRGQNPEKNIRYSGSPLAYSFGEAGQAKTFTLLDTETMERWEVPVQAGRPLRVLEGSFQGLLEGMRWSGGTHDLLKIHLTDGPAGMEKLQLLREWCPNLLLLTGTLPEGKEDQLTVGSLAEFTPGELMTRFYQETTGQPPDDQQMTWFLQALEALEEEGGVQ